MFFGLEPESEWQLDIHPSSYMIDEGSGEDADEEDREALARAYAQVEEVRSAIRKKKQVHFDGVEVPVCHPTAGSLKGTMPAVSDASASSSWVSPPVPSEPAMPTPAPQQRQSGTAIGVTASTSMTGSTPNKQAGASQQQFKYQSPMEDPAVAQRLLERLLDVQVTVLARELLSVSIDMHKMVHKLIATKRVAVASLETSSTPPSDLWLKYEEFIVRDDEGHVVVKTSLPLCALDGTLNDRLQEALGVPVWPDLATMLEAANKSKEDTLGVVENA
ncbi:hypothetical protein SCLCIDRAFT_23418 [Scleroderma citrinum Foug A]|uniref:DUF4100 domain-containing protein n=1 Tax=Scleroderma citrinum Foug A TaxID=1036808 RepID=A0A0C3DUU8_9AGAM|nr:hypothetical protein SCLCIDRAFT_23418 [Scleroderma citrinum Foug A]